MQQTKMTQHLAAATKLTNVFVSTGRDFSALFAIFFIVNLLLSPLAHAANGATPSASAHATSELDRAADSAAVDAAEAAAALNPDAPDSGTGSATPSPSETEAPADTTAATPDLPQPAVDTPAAATPPPASVSPTEAKALDESTLSRATPVKRRGKNFKPLLFAPEDNGGQLGRPQLHWELQNGTDFLLGGLNISSSQIGFHLTQLKREKSHGFFSATPTSPIVTTISFSWPQLLTRTGTMTIENLSGAVLFKKEITAGARSSWASYLKTTKAQKRPDFKAHAQAAWGEADIDPKDYAALFKESTIRVCLSTTTPENDKLHLCTGPQILHLPGAPDRVLTKPAAVTEAASAMIDGKGTVPVGLANFQEGKKISFGAKFSNGAYFEITSQPIQLRLYDVVESPSGQTIIITGQGSLPIGRVKIIKNPEEHFWSGTIVKQERVWQIAIPKEASTIRAVGAFNVPFTLFLNLSNGLPKEKDRAYLADRQNATYSSRPTLYGLVGTGEKVSSDQISAQKLDKEHFKWTFLAHQDAQENRARIKISDEQGHVWTAHNELFKSYSSEISGNLTGVLSSDGQAIAMAEVAASTWFEDLGFTDNALFALQRWGLDVSYFKSFSSITLASGDMINNFSTLSGDLKYNITHGVWNRDEMFGVMFSGEQVVFSNLKANLVGPGVYWARTMPKLLDDAFNFLPFLRHDKYLEVQFAYYALSLSSGVSAGSSYTLKFRGKVFFTPRFFGEGGFGVTQFDFSDNNQGTAAAFATAYGLIGIGLLF